MRQTKSLKELNKKTNMFRNLKIAQKAVQHMSVFHDVI